MGSKPSAFQTALYDGVAYGSGFLNTTQSADKEGASEIGASSDELSLLS